MNTRFDDAPEEVQQAIAKLEKQGLTFPNKPKDDIPVLPRDLTDLDESELMELFADFISWVNYAAPALSVAQVTEAQTEKQISFARSSLLAGTDPATKEKSVTVMKARAEVSDAVAGLEAKHSQAYAYRKMIEAMYYNLERDMNAVSREITRRSGEMKQRRRDRYTI